MIFSVRAMASAMNSEYIEFWMSARDGQVQTSPWFSANMLKPSRALS